MTDCESMPTQMVMDLKKMNGAYTNSGKIDPHLYRQLIGSLMYLVNTRPDICYAVNVLWIWPEICLQCRHEFARICQFRLGREHSGPEEHIRLLFYLGVCHGFLVQQET
jgi:hypothetical protein